MSVRSAIKKKIAEVKAQPSDIKPESKIRELQLELARCKSENETLKKENNSMRQKISLLESTMKNVNDLNIHLENEYESLKVEFSAIDNSLRDSFETVQKLQEKVRVFSNKPQSTEDVNRNLMAVRRCHMNVHNTRVKIVSCWIEFQS